MTLLYYFLIFIFSISLTLPSYILFMRRNNRKLENMVKSLMWSFSLGISLTQFLGLFYKDIGYSNQANWVALLLFTLFIIASASDLRDELKNHENGEKKKNQRKQYPMAVGVKENERDE